MVQRTEPSPKGDTHSMQPVQHNGWASPGAIWIHPDEIDWNAGKLRGAVVSHGHYRITGAQWQKFRQREAQKETDFRDRDGYSFACKYALVTDSRQKRRKLSTPQRAERNRRQPGSSSPVQSSTSLMPTKRNSRPRTAKCSHFQRQATEQRFQCDN